MKIAREGLWIILPSIIIPIILIWITGWRAWSLFFIFAAFMMFFFRNPDRTPPSDPSGILAPADGQIIMIEQAPKGTILFVELSFHNCHFQRAPMNGTITNITRITGKKRPIHAIVPRLAHAEKTVKSATKNEQSIIEMQLSNSKKIWITQMVGVFARRLKSYVKVGDQIQRGQRIGLIYFGSMVKLDMEGQYDLQVKMGDIVKAGSSIIAYPKAD